LIVWGENRERAIAKMKQALSELQIEGIKTVRDFHLAMMNNQDFIDNRFDTNYLSHH
ncbi:MAG: acetyl-CoA carboxylase biotin carboxylase subunit, partial [Epsilonproteobacteria bacterium]|nr:acetyl-CoA carboxylase biotin carboxylase subunit [Campylobacterota bacterium]